MIVLMALGVGISGVAFGGESQAPSSSQVTTSTNPQEQAPAAELSAEPMLSPWVGQILKLVEAGTDEVVVRSFVDSSGTFNLTAGQIAKLSDLGMPPWVLTAMITHDTELSEGLLPPPGPPPVPMLPRLALMKTNAPVVATTKAKSASQSPEAESIVNPSPAEDFWLWMFDSPAEMAGQAQSRSAGNDQTRPVREPYPVPLTDTIRIFKSAWRTPNVQVLEWFPKQ